MSIMCEECKCSIFDNDSGCDNGCGCCNREAINELLATRTAQLLAITDADRESGNSENPILLAESQPNRYQFVIVFFTDFDGVKITEDLNDEDAELSVQFFNTETEQDLIEGALYDWAINYYQNIN